MAKLLRVNMTDHTVREDEFPKEWERFGGRGLSAKILRREVPGNCDPMGEFNKLILAPGVLTGTAAPTSGRTSVGGKSPLTNGIKESNAGGQFGQKLRRLGYRAVIVEGRTKYRGTYLLNVTSKGPELIRADELRLMRTYACAERLGKNADKRAAFLMVGPAGELGYGNASVAITDLDNRYPTRHAARGGLGAVMGTKGLKAVLIDDHGTIALKAEENDDYRKQISDFVTTWRGKKNAYAKGTAIVVDMASEWGNLPTRNRRSGSFEGHSKINADAIFATFETRGGGMHNCLAGCIVQCSNTIYNEKKEYVTSALEFETLALLGANCGVDDLDAIAEFDRLCDELGMDTIETGAAIAVAMDGGVLPFGDVAGMRKLFAEMEKGTPLGRIIGNGAAVTGRSFNVERIPVVKGQAVPAWEPRTLRGTGITYCTSPMGADHTAGLVFGGTKSWEGLAVKSRESQIYNAVVDSSGFCQFQEPPMEAVAGFYSACLGETISKDDLRNMGWEILQDEWAFNRDAGYTRAADHLPEFMKVEPIPTNKMVFDVPNSELDKVYDLNAK